MAQPRRANRTPAAGRRPPAGSPVFGPCFACETRKPSFQACPLRMFWPNRPPVKGSSQAAPAGSQGAGLSASSGGCQTPERRGVCAGTSPPRGKRSSQQQQAAKGPVIGVAWRLRHRTGAQPAGQKHGARRLRWAGLLQLQIPVLTHQKYSTRIPAKTGATLKKTMLKDL